MQAVRQSQPNHNQPTRLIDARQWQAEQLIKKYKKIHKIQDSKIRLQQYQEWHEMMLRFQ